MIFSDQPDPTRTPAERRAAYRATAGGLAGAVSGGLAAHRRREDADPAQRTPARYVTPLEREWRAFLDSLPTLEG